METNVQVDLITQLVDKINHFFSNQEFELVRGDNYHSNKEFVCPKTEEGKKLVSEIEYLCSEIFINDDGSCDYSAINKFKHRTNNTMYIVRGEYDSFGWLTGIVVTNKGCFCYG